MSTQPSEALLMKDFTYELPVDRIAVRPVAERSSSRLLVAHGGTISHRSFSDLPSLLPEHSLLVVNNSRVFRARLALQKPTGGSAEVLLTAPRDPSQDPLTSIDASEWECLIGGRHITPPLVLTSLDGVLSATVLSRNGTEGTVLLAWTTDEPLEAVLARYGALPLPPYLGRAAEDDDDVRYQTVYARQQGSAAAPTAGLHFTNEVFAALDSKHVDHIELALHVGLGTFKPIEVEDARDHTMHTERFSIEHAALQRYVQQTLSREPFVTVVGTTSLRTLESLYWFGVQLIADPSRPLLSDSDSQFHIDQWSAFVHADKSAATRESLLPKRSDAFAAVLQWMDMHELDTLPGSTSIMLAPGCHIASADALVTNFHQPGNSLLLLVAAFAGANYWRAIYDAALDEGYRFLSYGDSSIIFR